MLVTSTGTEKSTISHTELPRSLVRYRLQKEKVAQLYQSSKVLWNVQHIHKLKRRNKAETLHHIAASEESDNGVDIVNSEALPVILRSSPGKPLRAENQITKTSNTQAITSAIDLLTDSSDDESIPTFFKPKNATVKQYKRTRTSNELRSYSTPMETQNIVIPINCSNAPSTSQAITITHPYMVHDINATVKLPLCTESSARTTTVIVSLPPTAPQLAAISNPRYDPNTPTNSTHPMTHVPKPADGFISDAEPTCERKCRSLQPKPSKPIQNRLYNSMLMNMSPSISSYNSTLPGASVQSWQPQSLQFSAATERPLNAPNLELTQHRVFIGMPNSPQGHDRLQILSPQDINNRIS